LVVYLRPDPAPRHLLNTFGLPKGAKILVSVVLKDGTWLIATTLGLAVAREGAGVFHAWDRIDRAALRQRGSVLAITFSGAAEPQEFAIDAKHKRFASVLAELVTASVVAVERVEAPGGKVIVALRRDPADQRIYLQEIADPGVDQEAAAPLVQAARHRLSEAAGLPWETR
jgi:ribosomal protein L25 (general stress protein Ctc)